MSDEKMTTTCPFCGAAFNQSTPDGEDVQYQCGTWINAPGPLKPMRANKCLKTEVARLTRERDEAINARNVIAKNIRAEMILKMQEVAKERDEARAEVVRLKAGGCARDQRTTQWCAEAVALQERVRRLEQLGRNLRQAVRLAVGDDATGWELGDGTPVGDQINAATKAWDKEAKP